MEEEMSDYKTVICEDCNKTIGRYYGPGLISGMCKECYEKTAKC